MRPELREHLRVELELRRDGDAARWVRELLVAFQPLRLLVVDLGRVRAFDEAALGQDVEQCRRLPGTRLELTWTTPGLAGAVHRLRVPAGSPAGC